MMVNSKLLDNPSNKNKLTPKAMIDKAASDYFERFKIAI